MKSKKFIKYIWQLIISVSNATFEIPSLRSCIVSISLRKMILGPETVQKTIFTFEEIEKRKPVTCTYVVAANQTISSKLIIISNIGTFIYSIDFITNLKTIIFHYQFYYHQKLLRYLFEIIYPSIWISSFA